MGRKIVWTKPKIKQAFQAFITKHDRPPKAREIDLSPDLPSSRMIQNRFGGLEALRKEFGYEDVHFGKGKHRSSIATTAGHRGREIEIKLENELIERFGEMAVHSEKSFNGKHRVDFYIYTPDEQFGIDIFYAETLSTLQSSFNIKMKKYQHFKKTLYIVVANPDFKQRELNQYIKNRKTKLPENIKLLTKKNLVKELRTKSTGT